MAAGADRDGGGDGSRNRGPVGGGAVHGPALVRLSDRAGRPGGSGFVADDTGTVVTSLEAVTGARGPLVLHGAGERSFEAGPDAVVPVPEHGLAFVRTDGLGVRPLPVAAAPRIAAGTYVHLAAGGWRQARVLRATGTALDLAIGTDGRDALRDGGEATGGPVLDVATGAVLGVLSGGPRAVPLRAAAAAAPDGPLAALLARNAATVPAYGPELNLAGALQLTATTLGAADGGPDPVARPAVARELAAFAAGPEAVCAVVGYPGAGRTTELAALARRRARGPEPAPTVWLRGADLKAGDTSLAEAVGRALREAGRIVAAAEAAPYGTDAVPYGTDGPPRRPAAGARGPGTGGPAAGPSPAAGHRRPVGDPAEPVDPARVAALALAAGRPLLVVLDAPEEMPLRLSGALAEWTAATLRWLRQGGARLVAGCRWEFHEYWEQAGLTGAPAVRLGDLAAPEAATVRGRYGIPDTGVAARDAGHPLTLRLLGEVRAAGVTEGCPDRDETFTAYLALVCLRIATRLTADPLTPGRGPGGPEGAGADGASAGPGARSGGSARGAGSGGAAGGARAGSAAHAGAGAAGDGARRDAGAGSAGAHPRAGSAGTAGGSGAGSGRAGTGTRTRTGAGDAAGAGAWAGAWAGAGREDAGPGAGGGRRRRADGGATRDQAGAAFRDRPGGSGSGRHAAVRVPGREVRRLAARVSGRVHEAARLCLSRGDLDRAAFEALFPWRTGWASAVLTEGLLVPAGEGYRFAHEEFADWLQAAHLDLPGALHLLTGPPLPPPRPATASPGPGPGPSAAGPTGPPVAPPPPGPSGGPGRVASAAPATARAAAADGAAAAPRVPRHRVGVVVEALLQQDAPTLARSLAGLVEALAQTAPPPPAARPGPAGPGEAFRAGNGGRAGEVRPDPRAGWGAARVGRARPAAAGETGPARGWPATVVGSEGGAAFAGPGGAAGSADGGAAGGGTGDGGAGEREWWAGRLLREVLLRLGDVRPYLGVLRVLALLPAPPGAGLGGCFWERLALPEPDRLDLLRNLLPGDAPPGTPDRRLDAVVRRLHADPRAVQPLLCDWFGDDTPLAATPGATVATAAQALLHTHRGLALDDLAEALVARAHPRADELLAVLAEEEPSALCRAVDRWSRDPRPERRVAAAAYGLATAPYAATPTDRDLLRFAALALLARPEATTAHGPALALLTVLERHSSPPLRTMPMTADERGHGSLRPA
ncbi:serine protease [Streptomyces sp. NRRL S-87]|uniref:serine protease n=1 Tax=Streptomyces sp. NRRL S-87 TaxID=1463920 RepID=UPI00068FB105|nr:serine protease [Streptomyces sp. NRRL S-87]